MLKRWSLVLGALLSLMLAATLTATPAAACVLGCSNPNIFVNPHNGDAGTWWAHKYTNGPVQIVEVHWTVLNDGDTVANVAVTSGATGCAQREAPYVSPSSLWLDPGESAAVTTYVKYFCIGSGTVYAGAGQDQGSQSITFTNP